MRLVGQMCHDSRKPSLSSNLRKVSSILAKEIESFTIRTMDDTYRKRSCKPIKKLEVLRWTWGSVLLFLFFLSNADAKIYIKLREFVGFLPVKLCKHFKKGEI
jgi:hypothetical protein